MRRRQLQYIIHSDLVENHSSDFFERLINQVMTATIGYQIAVPIRYIGHISAEIINPMNHAIAAVALTQFRLKATNTMTVGSRKAILYLTMHKNNIQTYNQSEKDTVNN